VLPAQECLERDHALRFDVDDRLVVHIELAALQCRAQARFDGDALLEALVHALAEELVVVAAAILRLVHGGVGVAQQLAHVGAVVRIESHPDADRGHERAPVHHHGRAQCAVDARGGILHPLGTLDPAHHDHELIAAHAHHQVIGAHGRAHALRHGLEQLVAALMAAGVVDMLEAIEIEEQYGEHRAVVLGFLDGVGQMGCEVQPVRESGEVIVMGEVIELLVLLEQLRLHLAANGDIVHRHREQLPAVHQNAIAGRLDVALGSVRTALAHLERGATGRILELEKQAATLDPLDAEDVVEPQRAQLIQRVAEVAERGRIARLPAHGGGVERHGSRRPLLEHREVLGIVG